MATLKDYRIESQTSLSEVARQSGVSPMTVKRVEEGKPIQEMSAIKLAAGISKILGRTIKTSDIEGLKVYAS